MQSNLGNQRAISMAWYQQYLSESYSSNSSAVVIGEQKLSYSDLGKYSRYMAHILDKQFGVKSGDFVAIMMEPSVEIFAVLHGIWLLGAAFVPLNPKLSLDRLEYIVDQAEIDLVVTQPQRRIDISLISERCQKSVATFMPDFAKDKIPLSRFQKDNSIAEVPFDEDMPAYMIYTSGTTGKPKGVVCLHRGLNNLALAVGEFLHLDFNSRVLQFARPSFDAFEFEAFPAFMVGATVVMGHRDELLPGKRLANFIEKYQTTHIVLPPTVLYTLNPFMDSLDSVTHILLEGEAAPPRLTQRWLIKDKRQVFNGYGPSECTVCSTFHKVDEHDTSEVPIGKAIKGAKTVVLDNDGKPVGAGNPGILWIGGEGVGRGYHKLEDKTADKFREVIPGEGRMYNTGDEVIEDEHGVLHFIGRLDNQVKIRGIRIELEAIEHHLLACPNVSISAVKVFEVDNHDGGVSKVLVAYLCPVSGTEIDLNQVKAYLKSHIPDYMMPHMYEILAQMPLMANLSKINRKALPTPKSLEENKSINLSDNGKTHKAYTVIDNPIEQVCAFFDFVLKNSVGSSKNDTAFFLQGGDSLTVMTLLDLIEDRFDVAIAPRLIYENQTPDKIVKLIHRFHHGEMVDKTPQAISESLLKDASYTLPNTIYNCPQTKPQNILLTGATGFLGIHILNDLLSQETVKRVYCLVRAQNEQEAMSRIKNTYEKYYLVPSNLKKCIPVVGDITEDKLGFADNDYVDLSEQVDAVIHSAASISYISAYDDIAKPNVLGTKAILDFCSLNKVKALHHVSSMSVFGATYTLLDKDIIDEHFNIDDSLALMPFENGYTRAKWVSEKMAFQAKAAGLPVSIYRPGFIQGHSLTGASNLDDLFCRLLMGNIKLKFYADFDSKYWLPVPVDYVAKALNHIALNQKPGGVYHLISQREQEPDNNTLFKIVNDLGYPMAKIPFADWIEKVRNLNEDNPLFPLVRFLTEKIYYNERTVYELHHISSNPKSENTLNALKGTKIKSPPIDKHLLKRYLDFYFK